MAPRSDRRDIIDRLNEEGFAAAYDKATLREMARVGQQVSLAGGHALFERGDTPDALYLVLSGRLIVVRGQRAGTIPADDTHTDNIPHDEAPARDEVIGYVRAGELVGEMALLAGDTHSASVYALRDSDLLRIPREAFEDLFDDHADFAGALARAILKRSRSPHESMSAAAPRVFALIAPSPSIDIDAIAHELAREIAGLGSPVTILDQDDPAPAHMRCDIAEETHDVVLIAARVGDNAWYRFALRHADRFFVFARRDAYPPSPLPLATSAHSPARRFRLVDLVMIDEGRAPAGVPTVRRWAEETDANRIFRWTTHDQRARLARAIAGRTVALVLSGGGARAYAHIGAIRAFREAGLPIDFVCGSSMGAVIAACIAMGWDDAEIERRIRDGFVQSNPLGDHVIPVVALTRGEIVEERLKRHFGERLIEDLELPFFCISSELTAGAEFVHRRGLVRNALRATIALPGILPPVVDGDHLLVDGAVVNNFPAGLMRSLHRGVTIGIDVARKGSISTQPYARPPGFFQWIRKYGFRATPPIVPLLMRAATARREYAIESDVPDILITPPVPGVELRDWKKFDDAVAEGYAHARAAINANRALLDPYCVSGDCTKP